MAQTIQSNRVVNESGTGVQALRRLVFQFNHASAAGQSPVLPQDFPVDVDVIKITVIAGLVPADNAGNVINIFNGTVAGAKSIGSLNYHTAALSAEVPVDVPVTVANQRVKAGTPISVQCVMDGDDSAASAQIVVEVDINIPIDTPYAGVKTTTYQTYDAGF